MGNSFSIEFIGNSNFNFIQHIQNVKFCQSNAARRGQCQWKLLYMCFLIHWWCGGATTKHLAIFLSVHSRCEAINHMSISDDDKIQPAATPLPSCGYADLMTPRLQQLSYCLKTEKHPYPFNYTVIN